MVFWVELLHWATSPFVLSKADDACGKVVQLELAGGAVTWCVGLLEDHDGLCVKGASADVGEWTWWGRCDVACFKERGHEVVVDVGGGVDFLYGCLVRPSLVVRFLYIVVR